MELAFQSIYSSLDWIDTKNANLDEHKRIFKMSAIMKMVHMHESVRLSWGSSLDRQAKIFRKKFSIIFASSHMHDFVQHYKVLSSYSSSFKFCRTSERLQSYYWF